MVSTFSLKMAIDRADLFETALLGDKITLNMRSTHFYNL
jgi:hypothetical protein